MGFSQKQTSGQHCICDIISAVNHSTKQIGYQTLCIRVKGMVLMISTQPFPEYENTSLISSGSKDSQLLFFSSFLFFTTKSTVFFFVSKWSNILTLNRKLAKTFTISGIKPVTPLRPWTSWSTFELGLS